MTTSLLAQRAAANVLLPPFPWNGIERISDLSHSRFRNVEQMLSAASAYILNLHSPTLGRSIEVSRWAELPGLRFQVVDLSDRNMLTRRAEFVKRLGQVWLSPSVQRVNGLLDTASSTFRTRNVYAKNIAGWRDVRYYPPTVLLEQMRAICTVNKNFPSLSPLARIFGTYVHFLFVHPFADENGRAARRLLRSLLGQYGNLSLTELPIGYLIRMDRARHNRVLNTFAATSNWDPLLDYFCDLTCAAAELMVRLQPRPER